MIDPRERYADPEEVMRIATDSAAAKLWVAVPGIIESVNYAEMTVVVQPATQARVLQSNGSVQNVNLPLLLDVPIVFMSGGNVILTMPIAAGDEALVIFANNCIDSWWQLGGVQAQTDIRLHDLSDGFALIGPRSQAKLIAAISQTTAQFRSVDGSTYMEVNPATKAINIIAPGGFNVTGPTNFTGTVQANDVDIGSTHEHGYIPGTAGEANTTPPTV
jgi:hypothetical protein